MQTSCVQGSLRTTPFDMWTAISENYRVLGDLTVGRDGTSIKKAKCRATDEYVTLKVMPIRDDERRASCTREAELLASVNHRNILAFHAAYECATEFVLVTEFCPGGDLLDAVNSGGKLPEKEARGYMSQIVSALQYLLARGIAHRDVKLDNIFIGERGVLKLGDFGFARRFTEGERFNNSCGTLVYVAPELLVPHPDFDPIPAEVYSLGITLFAMCAAYLPYDAMDETQVIADVRRGGCAMPTYFSPELAELVRRMISISPSARPSLAAVRDSEWLAPTDRFQRSFSHPRMHGSQLDARPRANSVPDSVSQRMPATSAVNVAGKSNKVNELPVVTVRVREEATASSKSKRGSWLYRKLVKPITSRLSSKNEVATPHA